MDLLGEWEDFLSVEPTEGEVESLRKHERTGRPLGSPSFVGKVESMLKRTLRPGRPGPKPNKHLA